MADAITIEAVHDVGDDVLEVTATVDGETFIARGWVSATTNYYPPESYGEFFVDETTGEWQPVDSTTPADAPRDVHLIPGAEPRAMTAAEVGAYAQQLVADQYVQPTPAPAPIAFEAP